MSQLAVFSQNFKQVCKLIQHLIFRLLHSSSLSYRTQLVNHKAFWPDLAHHHLRSLPLPKYYKCRPLKDEKNRKIARSQREELAHGKVMRRISPTQGIELQVSCGSCIGKGEATFTIELPGEPIFLLLKRQVTFLSTVLPLGHIISPRFGRQFMTNLFHN